MNCYICFIQTNICKFYFSNCKIICSCLISNLRCNRYISLSDCSNKTFCIYFCNFVIGACPFYFFWISSIIWVIYNIQLSCLSLCQSCFIVIACDYNSFKWICNCNITRCTDSFNCCCNFCCSYIYSCYCSIFCNSCYCWIR